ncbi:MAG: hypothetical protein ACI8S6_000696 [Myxococcota bacterium]|jgi:hypothetical protein
MHLLALIAQLACTTPPAPSPAVTTTEDLDQGQQHPPIPADNPVWSRDVGGFVPEYRWYGEHSWADVRMRVAGHLSAAGRDRARLDVQRGDLTAASARYRDLAEQLARIPVEPGGTSEQINALLRDAASRDAALTAALSRGEPPPIPDSGLAALRARYLGLALRHGQGEDVSAEAAALQAELTPHLTPRADLDLDAFEDFNARHDLRTRLFAAYLDSLDPLGIEERWGYWEAAEVTRQARLLGLSLAALGGSDFSQGDLLGTPPPLQGADALRWPSMLADALRSPDQQPDFTPAEIGALPTGDTLIDTAGHPGPRAIGTLQKLGLDDPSHQDWLAEMTGRLDSALGDEGALIVVVREGVGSLDRYGHGSRYYNIKQLRNAAVRQLALSGEHAAAAAVLADSWPLHHQDWACPNRAGILRAVEGRLRAEAGDPEAAAVLERALAEGEAFLVKVEQAARRPPPGPPNGAGRGGPGGGPARPGPPR